MKKIILLIGFLLISITIYTQEKPKSATITGNVVSESKSLPYATILVNGTTLGTTTNYDGNYTLSNLKPGTYTITAQSNGFKPYETTITIKENETLTLKFELEPDILGLNEIVITGNRSKIKRKKASTIVNIINTDIFETTQSVTLGEVLNFCPGLRMENDCQNCGFSQIRMNGLEGPYSQILINSRPIFSGLAGVYGLELIPSNMIDKVEIIRGGGSALYGSNAIAGTINLILKDPTQNSYEIGFNSSIIGVGVDDSKNTSEDYSVNFNTSVVSNSGNTGLAVYGFHRDRDPFDANNDSFSEIASLKNTTIGSRLFQKIGTKAKLAMDFFHINEDRRGGNKFSYPNHEADISEAVKHNLTTGALTFEQYYREKDLFSVFASAQKIDRDSYYGANQSLSDYGNTKDFTYNTGIQYNAFFKNSNLILGVENTGSTLKDKKLGYLDYENALIIDNEIVEIPHTENTIVANQSIYTTGVFSQYEIKKNKLTISLGARLDWYKVKDKQKNNADKTGDVLSPRISFLYDIQKNLQARLSYSKGYRAPQIFDEDLHIETSGSRQVIHVNDPDLKQETSSSYMASLDYSGIIGNTNFGFLVEGFYTKLNDPFSNEFSEPDENGTVIYTRINAKKGAKVQGLNFELNIVPNNKFSLKAGYTYQKSEYEEVQEFNEKTFFRTPDNYGYIALDWEPTTKWCFSTTGNYTGEMLVPYFGPTITNPDEGELRKSDTFFDLGLKIRHNIKIKNSTLQLYSGVKNIFNSYQDDFDSDIDRDPAYVYGPMNPRTIYFGLKFGNLISL
ncbi:TonB-dependent receptor [Lutibacter sp. B1]|uniref:TonB-dependent receptor n=1 Tax=Lutibacter sp. B1 TaxID=2725996 RepID=UPI001457823B|nr:TonB-dependent receptor [Lutibacter sp. B1]NLP57650.1 TonB-dependent receptor [Lutibacter sp. B1]